MLTLALEQCLRAAVGTSADALSNSVSAV
jgi:hypothetical protein